MNFDISNLLFCFKMLFFGAKNNFNENIDDEIQWNLRKLWSGYSASSKQKAGKIDRHKNPNTLIEHFSDFKFEISNFQLWIVASSEKKLAGFPFWVSTFWSQRNFHFIEFPFLPKFGFVKFWANFHFIEFPFYRERTVLLITPSSLPRYYY